MPEPTVSQGHLDAQLTNVSVAFMQEDSAFVADAMFPIVPVAHASDVYLVYPREAFFRDDVGPRPMGGYSPSTGHKLARQTYHAEEEGLTAWLDDRERANVTPPYDPERSKVRLITAQHMIHRDKRFVSAYMKTGVWTTDVAGVAAAPGAAEALFWSLSTSTPAKEVRKRKRVVKRLTGFEPNKLVIGSDVELELINHPDLIDRTKYTGDGAVSLDLVLVAQYFGVEKVVVGVGVENTADEGLTGTNAFIVGAKDALLTYAPPEPGLDVPSAGYIFAWTGLLGQSAASPAAVWRGRDERAHSDWFECRTAYDMRVVAPDLGVFFNEIVA